MLLYLCSNSSRWRGGLLSWLGGQALHQHQWNDVGGLVAADELATDGALRAFLFTGASTVLARDEGLHQAGVAEQVAW